MREEKIELKTADGTAEAFLFRPDASGADRAHRTLIELFAATLTA
jgi:hypothetical protein